MKPAIHQTDAELTYNIADINAAIAAMPENPKLYTYLDQRGECRDEQHRRELKRSHRRTMAGAFDLMNFPVRVRRHYRGRLAVSVTAARWAAWADAWDRRLDRRAA